MILSLCIIAGLILIWLGVGAYVFFTACRRNREMPWLDKEALQKTQFGKYADALQDANGWLKAQTTEDVYITSFDGLKLHATWIPAVNAKGTILLAHGYRSNKLMDFGVAVPMSFYRSLGLNILAIDQRSHGLSQGKYITFGVKESRDVMDWIQYFNQHLGGGDLILAGLSMGAATVMYTADEKLPGNVKGRIVDCGFTSPAQIISKVFRDVVRFSPGPFIWSAELFARIFGGFSLYAKDSRCTLSHNNLPILMIHGCSDDFVPCYMTEQGYEACKGDKKLLLVENAVHGASYMTQTKAYTDFVKDLLGRTLYALCSAEEL